MRAMLLHATGSLDANPEPLVLAEVADPEPGNDEILVRVAACGVCHTELDEIEGRTPPPRLPVIPGHEVVGRVAASGRNAVRFHPGQRVGVGWIHSSDGTASENISPAFRATGRDANGGYAELMTVPEAYAAPVPDDFGDVEAAPLIRWHVTCIRTAR
jgi:propanol-preferring alcohol dehydrogenase